MLLILPRTNLATFIITENILIKMSYSDKMTKRYALVRIAQSGKTENNPKI